MPWSALGYTKCEPQPLRSHNSCVARFLYIEIQSQVRRMRLSIFTVVVFLVCNLSVVAQQDSPGTNEPDNEIKQPVLDAETRLSWHQKHLEMQDEAPTKSLKWKHIGPQLMSGRVTDIAKPLDLPSTFYVATASGGLWKTVNEGTTWKPVFDDAPSGSVGAVAVDPNDSKTVWVGLGESNVFRSTMSGTGIYRSQDGGEIWQHMGLAETHHIARVIVHPEDSRTVYVAASGREYTENEERGVYRTTDGGETWEKVLYIDAMTGAIDLAIDRKNPEVLYASMWRRIRRPWSDPLPGKGNGVFKSADGGETWNPIGQEFFDNEKIGRIGIAISESNPDVLYALADSHKFSRKAKKGEKDAYGRAKGGVIEGAVVFRSDDAGENWERVSGQNRRMQRLFSTYGWVFGQIRVDPSDENTIYALGISLLKSTDGGKSFKRLISRDLHSDHHALWIDPQNPDRLISGNDGGINLSYDGGANWKNLENLPVVQFYNVALDNATPFNVYGSIQDNGSWSGPSDHRPGLNEARNWRRVPGGEASYMQVDPDDDTFYSESFYGSIMRSSLATGKSTRIKPVAEDKETILRGQWLAPFQLSPHNSRVVYHGMQSVFRSMDQGRKWTQISPDLSRNDSDKRGNIPFATITALSESPMKFGLLCAGTDDGRLHLTKNGGESWSELRGPWPETKWVSRVELSRFNEATVYVTLNGKRDNDFQVYVFQSDDYGQTWVDIGVGIPGGPVNVIREDLWSENLLYVGTDLGIYLSTDQGDSWGVLGSELPVTFVHDLAIHARDQKAVIATHGRGMFVLDIKELNRGE